MQPAATPSAPSTLERLRDGYGRVLEWVVGALMVVLAVEVTLGVVFRGIGRLARLVRRGRLGAAGLADVLRRRRSRR